MTSRSTLAALVLACALATRASPASADSTRPPPVTAVAVMKDTGQALVWDGLRAEYVLVKAGDSLQSYFVVTISDVGIVVASEADPKIRHTLRLTAAPTHVVDPAKPRSPTAITLAPSAVVDPGADLGVEDPYPGDGLSPVDPYPIAPRVVIAPTVIQAAPDPDPLIPSVRAPGASAVPRSKPPSPQLAPSGPSPSPAPAAKPAKSAETAKPRHESVDVPRAELNAALADFSALSKEVQIEPAKGGGVRVLGLARGSLLHRAGLRRGDIVRSVAGERPTSVESAARIYARLQVVDRFEVEVDRDGQRIIFGFTLK